MLHILIPQLHHSWSSPAVLYFYLVNNRAELTWQPSRYSAYSSWEVQGEEKTMIQNSPTPGTGGTGRLYSLPCCVPTWQSSQSTNSIIKIIMFYSKPKRVLSRRGRKAIRTFPATESDFREETSNLPADLGHRFCHFSNINEYTLPRFHEQPNSS